MANATHDVTITIIDNPLETDARETSSHAWGGSLRDALPERVRPDGSWIVVEHGQVIPPTEWAAHCLLPDAEFICYPRAQNAIARMAAGAVLIAAGLYFQQPWAVAAGIGLLAGGTIELLMGPPSLPALPALTTGDQQGSLTYGFEGIKNSTRVGAPIPVVFGGHRVGGPILSQCVETEHDDAVRSELTAIGERHG